MYTLACMYIFFKEYILYIFNNVDSKTTYINENCSIVYIIIIIIIMVIFKCYFSGELIALT